MSIDKKISYVEQDGSLNFIKNSKSVTVPKRFKARKNAPATKLAYITDAEAKMLKKMKKGTPHKGPKGIPSYDSFGSIDASGKDTGMAGGDVSRAESGDFGPIGGGGGPELPPGVKRKTKPTKEEQELRSAFIAAGGGQRVNPGFFDSRNTVSPAELRAAKQFAPKAFKKARGTGGLLGLLSGGGILGNIIRSLGQRFGLGKKFNQPTYDMSQFSDLGLLTDRVNPDYYNDLDNELALSTIADPKTVAPMPVDTGSKIKIRPDVNLLAQPVYNLDGSVRKNDAFGYLDLPDGYFDTNTNINTNKNTNTSGGIIPLLDSNDLGDELEQVVGKLNLSS